MTATYNWPVLDSLFREEEAEYYCSILQENGITYVLNRPQEQFNVATGSSTQDIAYVIQVSEDDFGAANDCINRILRENLVIEPDYYLNGFTSAELRQVLAEKDTWSRIDYITAIQLLEHRGEAPQESQLQELTRQRNRQLFQTRKTPVTLLLTGCVTVITFPYLAMVIGIYLNLLKTHDLEGRRFFYYSRSTRIWGIVLFVAAIAAVIWFYEHKHPLWDNL